MRKEPGIGALAAIAQVHPRPPPGLPAPRDRASDDIIAYLAAEGRPALAELAGATGMSETDFLLSVFGDGRRQRLQDRR